MITDTHLFADAIREKAGIASKLATMTMADYQAAPGISKSRLDDLHRSPAHYKYAQEHPEEPTPAMIAGSVFHKLVLEPADFAREFAVIPDGIDRRTKDGKETWALFQAENAEKKCIDRPIYEELIAMRDSLMSSNRVQNLLAGGKFEQSIFWKAGELDCKSRIDCIKDDIVMDVKTCRDARPDEFSRDCWKFRYHVQAAFYSDAYEYLTGRKAAAFVFVAVEKTAPYCVSIFMADGEMVDQGRREYLSDLEIYAECLKTGIWPGYTEEVQALLLPTWARDEEARNGY